MMSKKVSEIIKCKRCFGIQAVQNKNCVLNTFNFQNNYNNNFNLVRNNFLIEKRCNGNIRQFYTFSKKLGYFTTELNYARKVMGDSENYADCLVKSLKVKDNLDSDDIENIIAKQWISMSNTEILENFELISYYAKKNLESESIENPKYRGIIEIICNKCQDFSDKELHHLMSCLNLWYVKKEEKVFQSIWKVIDNECMKRMPKWSINELFMVNDQFYKLRIARLSEFSWHSLKKLNLKLKHLTPTQLVQFAFLLKVNREIPMNLYNLEYYTEQNFDHLSIEELAIIAMPFAKYDTPIRSKKFLIKLMQKLRNNFDNVSDVTLTSILKIIRYFNNKEVDEELESFLKSLETQISHRPLPTVAQIAVLKDKLLLHNKDLLIQLLERFEKDIKEAALRDIEKVLVAACTFNYNSEKTPFYSVIENELLNSRRAEEINKNPNLMLRMVENLFYVNYFPKKCVEEVMNPEFIKKVSRDNVFNLNTNHLLIDYCLELDHPEYDGPRLSEELKSFLIEQHGAFKEKIIHRFRRQYALGKISTDVLNNFKEILSSETNIHLDSLLPYHPTREMILCYDPKNKEFAPPREKLSQMPIGSIKYAPDDGKLWYVILIGTFNLVTQNTGYPTGFLGMYMRHLKKIGYETILIPNKKWTQYTNNGNEKKNYLNNIISNHIK